MIRNNNNMSSSSDDEMVEHIVLFKLKPSADPSSMLSNINSLASLDIATHLAVGPVSRCHSTTNPSLTFTHMLHSRYPSKSALSSYLGNPSHINVVANYVSPVVDDIMVLDWVANDFSGSPAVPPGSVVRFTLLMIKEEESQEAVMGIVKDKFSKAEQLTVGVNFSPAKAKGYSIGSMAIVKGFDPEMEEVSADVEEVKELVDDVLVIDFIVPVPPTEIN